jgi:hypothetical protein
MGSRHSPLLAVDYRFSRIAIVSRLSAMLLALRDPGVRRSILDAFLSPAAALPAFARGRFNDGHSPTRARHAKGISP